MDENRPTLEYARPQSRVPTQLDDFVTGLFVGRLRSKWFYLQSLYYFVLAVSFCVFGLWIGPNFLNFGRISGVSGQDFVPDVQQRCVPVVRAMKEYLRDHGQLPNAKKDLVPDYLPDESHVDVPAADVWGGALKHWGRWNHHVTYDFTPGQEGFYVSGPFMNGRLPMPPVKIEPSTNPTTRGK